MVVVAVAVSVEKFGFFITFAPWIYTHHYVIQIIYTLIGAFFVFRSPFVHIYVLYYGDRFTDGKKKKCVHTKFSKNEWTLLIIEQIKRIFSNKYVFYTVWY